MGMTDFVCVGFAVSVAVPGALCALPRAKPSDKGGVCRQKQEDELCFSCDRLNEQIVMTTEGQRNSEVDALLNKVPAIQQYEGDPLCEGKPQSKCPHHASGNGHCGIRHTLRQELLLSPRVTSCGYYYYHGSLTTPTLSESVLWRLIKQPIRISRVQLSSILSMYTHFPGVRIKEHGNLRPLQKRNGRTIYANICGKIDD
ncbi:carbonic anhydrase 4-like [Haliotis rubra]|uniref:carbonic anhydrase 4-like n=1 Tax=Haliotis rubra TaxID=36100 RepID=UPI001EE61298|nr:carbonic anhydrase 4-like [Haliotis rubra]